MVEKRKIIENFDKMFGYGSFAESMNFQAAVIQNMASAKGLQGEPVVQPTGEFSVNSTRALCNGVSSPSSSMSPTKSTSSAWAHTKNYTHLNTTRTR